jgi:hypothetical protein
MRDQRLRASADLSDIILRDPYQEIYTDPCVA